MLPMTNLNNCLRDDRFDPETIFYRKDSRTDRLAAVGNALCGLMHRLSQHRTLEIALTCINRDIALAGRLNYLQIPQNRNIFTSHCHQRLDIENNSDPFATSQTDAPHLQRTGSSERDTGWLV